MVVRFVAIRALTVTSTFTTTSTVKEGAAATAGSTFLTEVAAASRAVVISRQLTGRTLTVSLGCATQNGCRSLVEDLHFDEARITGGSTEVIATLGAAFTAHAAQEAVSEVAGGAGCQVGIEVMTATPCGTIAVVVVLVVTSLVPAMSEVVGQGEQEVGTVSGVSSSVPLCDSITTDQFACTKLYHSHCSTFAVTSTVEGRRTGPVNTAFVTDRPVLVDGSNPGVDLGHLSEVQERTPIKLVFLAGFGSRAIVATVSTSILFDTRAFGEARFLTLVASATNTVVFAGLTFGLTVTVTCTVTAVATSDELRPVVAGLVEGTLLTITTGASVAIGLTLVAVGCCGAGVGIRADASVATTSID